VKLVPNVYIYDNKNGLFLRNTAQFPFDVSGCDITHVHAIIQIFNLGLFSVQRIYSRQYNRTNSAKRSRIATTTK